MAGTSYTTVKFSPFQSALDTSFWSVLSKKKLEEYGLDDQARTIQAIYTNGNAGEVPTLMNFDYTSFESNAKVPPKFFPCRGILKNFNTIDEFRNSNKQEVLDTQGRMLWDDIVSGRTVETPSLLNPFLLLTFADLKKYCYYYWFAFPALKCPAGSEPLMIEQNQLSQVFTSQQIEQMVTSYDALRQSSDEPFFIITEHEHSLTARPLKAADSIDLSVNQVYFVACDACTRTDVPGWPVRNLLTLIAQRWSSQCGETVKVISFRDRYTHGQRNVQHSTVFQVKLPSLSDLSGCPKCVGWEKNVKGEMGPRLVNLSSSMDPSKLAESAVDLNLKLMKWRLLPDLDLEVIQRSRCLLLGSGTLGCNVARCLLGWGVRNITLVDNGRVSYSNPVRQSLFTFADSMQGGKPKAQAAAEALEQIFPGVNASGETLSIPMPGHSVSAGVLEDTRACVARLEALVDAHDVIFLLMDTRESRWLPTVMAASKRKIVINSALGFDTFLVMRHGVKSENMAIETGAAAMEIGAAAMKTAPVHLGGTISGCDLGCYFCNDVVAPGDSTKDRTLDQQCTVSRPGMSYLASALAVELLVSVLVHPDRGDAAADTSAQDSHLSAHETSPLGLVPHQIRGFLSRFHHVMPASRAFDKCTACSHTVIENYERRGFEFLLNVFNSPSYLEDITGLTQMHADTCLSEVWELDDDDDISM